MPSSGEVDLDSALRLFNDKQSQSPSESGAVCAIDTLLHFLSSSRAKTLQEVVVEQRKISEHLWKEVETPTTPVKSGCELFIRFITLVNQGLEETDFEKTKQMLVLRGANFRSQCAGARDRISHLGHRFLRDGATVLTHSRSRVVAELIKRAAKDAKRLSVYVTQSAPDHSGEEMKTDLEKAGVQTTLILDSAVAYIMEKVDVVLVGAEGVVENGGIIKNRYLRSRHHRQDFQQAFLRGRRELQVHSPFPALNPICRKSASTREAA